MTTVAEDKSSTKSTCDLYSQADKARSLINNKCMSDIAFLVGESNEVQKTIYGHKFLLAMGSPVFEKMFFGDLAEKNNVIEIPDLTPAGFLNMIRYIYGEKPNFKLHEIYETYMAASKYMVYNLTDALLNHLNNSLNEANKVLIYDQLVKIKVIDPLVDDELMENMKLTVDKSAFGNDFFNKISQDTLIYMLSIECLGMDEFFILKSCLNWINASNSTTKDKRKRFKSILPYIDLARITIDNFKEIKQLDSFLTHDEIGSLFMFLFDPKNRSYPFQFRITRKQIISVNFSRIEYDDCNFFSEFITPLVVNHDVHLKSIETSLTRSMQNVKFELSLENEILKPIIYKKFQDDRLVLLFHNFKIKKDFCYNLKFSFDTILIYDKPLSIQLSSEFNIGADKIVVKLKDSHHCIWKVNFFIDDK